MSFAHVTLHGHLGRDPETRAIAGAGDATVTTIALAVTRSYKRNGEQHEATTWWRAQIWGTRGKTVAKHLRKGDAVIIHGTPELRQYVDRDGITRSNLEVLNADFSFVGSRRADAGAPAASAASEPAKPLTPNEQAIANAKAAELAATLPASTADDQRPAATTTPAGFTIGDDEPPF